MQHSDFNVFLPSPAEVDARIAQAKEDAQQRRRMQIRELQSVIADLVSRAEWQEHEKPLHYKHLAIQYIEMHRADAGQIDVDMLHTAEMEQWFLNAGYFPVAAHRRTATPVVLLLFAERPDWYGGLEEHILDLHTSVFTRWKLRRLDASIHLRPGRVVTENQDTETEEFMQSLKSELIEHYKAATGFAPEAGKS